MTSIDHAVVFLGFNTIKNLALGIAAVSLAPESLHTVMDHKAYLQHSLATAAVTRQLGTRFAATEANDFFIGGLLHDFGKMVLAQVMPAQFRKALEFGLWHEVSLHSALMEVMGLDQAEVAAMLLEHWRFPATLVDGIRNQYVLDDSAPPMSVCIYAANQICKLAGVDFGTGDKAQALSAHMEHALGGKLESVMASLGDVTALLDSATHFVDP
jgi:HD-like signal output (HDOD) protein